MYFIIFSPLISFFEECWLDISFLFAIVVKVTLVLMMIQDLYMTKPGT